MNKKTKISTYESPLVLEEVLNIEQGFATSAFGEAGAAGAALGALAGKLSHSGKVGTIVGLAAAGLSAILAFVTGGKG